MTYRLSINLGATYLAWCVLDLDGAGNGCRLRDMGVRSFPDGREPQRKESLAVARRDARYARRRRDRFKSRQRRLIALMTEHGLMPADEDARRKLERENPYQLRARALDERLSLHEIGRALFHINQRRGFKSNRKRDSAPEDTGAIRAGIAALEHALRSHKCRTLGEYLAKRRERKEPVRARPAIEDQRIVYEFFPSRAMCEHEVDAILQKQRTYYPELLGAIGDKLKRILLYQRPQKPPAPGSCMFEPGERRARIAYPALQTFRILKQVNALEIDSLNEDHPPLTAAERTAIIDRLHESETLSFAAVRKLLKRPKDTRFNFEADRSKALQGDATALHLAHPDCFGVRWHQFTEHQQNAVIDLLLEEPDPEAAAQRLMSEFGLTSGQAQRAIDAPLEDRYASLSLKAAHRLLPLLKRGFT